MLTRKVDEEVVEVDTSKEQPDGGQEDVLDERVDDRSEGDTENERESQREDIRLE